VSIVHAVICSVSWIRSVVGVNPQCYFRPSELDTAPCPCRSVTPARGRACLLLIPGASQTHIGDAAAPTQHDFMLSVFFHFRPRRRVVWTLLTPTTQPRASARYTLSGYVMCSADELHSSPIDGTSKGLQFEYAGTLADPSGPLTGTWSGENASDVWSATFVSGYSPLAAAGNWTMLANWGTGTFALAIGSEGYLTGSMSDTNGASNLEGVFDLGDGSLFFRKVYTSGSTFWYYGSMNTAGTQITAGTWGNSRATLNAGTWTASK
jgi:hypothetical protein